MKNRRLIIKNQLGLVSIMVTMVMMIIISLLVLTYSQVIRREQRQTLDRQLNTQAFYAAESAINAVNRAIDLRLAAGDNPSTFSKPNCGGAPPPWLVTSAAIPSSAELEVTCLTVDPVSYSLVYSSIPKDGGQTMRLLTTGATNIAKIEIAWQSDITNSGPYAAVTPYQLFPSQGGWGSTAPVLRVDLIAGNGPLDPTSLYNATQVYFLYPNDGAAGAPQNDNIPGVISGDIVHASCNANTVTQKPKACRATLVGISGALINGKDYYLRIRPIYSNASVVVTPLDASAPGGPIALTGGQITIDATGRSSDVLKRVQIRRPVNGYTTNPGFALDSASNICKLVLTDPTDTSDDGCGGF